MSMRLAIVLVWLAACFSKPRFDGDAGGRDAASDGPRGVQLTFMKLAAGAQHVCAIDLANQLWCWGDNANGQLGGTPVQRTGDAILATELDGWVDVAAGAAHTCGIRVSAMDGQRQLYCWGNDDRDQTSPGSNADSSPTQVVLPESAIPQVVFAGGDVSCAITSGATYCWGDLDFNGGSHAITALPERALQIALASDHGCATTAAPNLGTICWGDNSAAQLGSNDMGPPVGFADAVSVSAPVVFSDLALAVRVSCGIAESHVYCWGINDRGHLGLKPSSAAPRQIDDNPWTDVAVGEDFVCVLNENEEVHCYGDAVDGSRGVGDFLPNRSIVIAPTLTSARAVVAGGTGYACALDGTGHASCWGSNRRGELGNGKIASKTEPSRVALPPDAAPIQEIAAGDEHTCALAGPVGQMRAYCWGHDPFGQIDGQAQPGAALIPMPKLVETPSLATLSVGPAHNCAVTDAGAFACWGRNDSLQLGTTGGNRFDSPQSPKSSAWLVIDAGERATCGVDVIQNLFCWGQVPALGSQQLTSTTNPIAGMWFTVAVGATVVLGQQANGMLYGFGQGCLLGSTTPGDVPPSQPAAIMTSGPARFAPSNSSSNEHVCASHVDGTAGIACWGDNTWSQVGTSSTCSGPEQRTLGATAVPAPVIDVSTVATARKHSCALGMDRLIYCWGLNEGDVLGNLPTGLGDSVPHVVASIPFAEITTGRTQTCGIAADRSAAYCWGENRVGQLGDGTSFEPSPVPAGFDTR